MITVGAFEAKTNLSRLIDQAAHGEQITVSRHGVPVARLVPFSEVKTEYSDSVEQLRELSVGVSLGDLSVTELIKEGRKH